MPLWSYRGFGVERGHLFDIPEVPAIEEDEIWPGTPNVVIDQGHYTIGWQGWPDSKGGPGFVTLRRGAFGSVKLVDRYPMTEDGWSRAWQELVTLDPATADAARAALDHRARRRGTKREQQRVDAATIMQLPHVVCAGGNAAVPLTAGQGYVLRFMRDKVAVCPLLEFHPVLEIEYSRVQAFEISGPGQVEKWRSLAEVMVLGFLGTVPVTKIKTFLRIQVPAGELFFMHTGMPPDELRIRLSPVFARLPTTGASVTDELTRLAALVDKGLLTRQEFDAIKAKLLAGL
jgi:hypothetical protein